MPPAVTITVDVEDLRPTTDLPERVVEMTHRVLDLLAETGHRASVFMVGELAERRPNLVRRAAAEGATCLSLPRTQEISAATFAVAVPCSRTCPAKPWRGTGLP